MAIPDANSTLQRLRNRYRLVVMNEDTFEEVVAFKFNVLSVQTGVLLFITGSTGVGFTSTFTAVDGEVQLLI